MPGPYSSDPRIRAVEAVEQGKTVREVAKMPRIAVATMVRLHQRHRRTGSVDPLPMGGDRRSSNAEQHSKASVKTRKHLDAAIEASIKVVKATHAPNYLRNSGYGFDPT